MNSPIPLSRRRADWIILAFFLINVLFITYVVDLEQLVISDPSHFTYPAWPPAVAVDADAVHNYGRTFDPVLIARPAWWKVLIWIDVLFFGPFYVVAIYAFWNGKEWIRIPSIIYAAALITDVLVILGEELYGVHATPHPEVVLVVNAPWLLVPIFILVRMGTRLHPFTAVEPAASAPPVTAGTFNRQAEPSVD
jgi:hypothetical protein